MIRYRADIDGLRAIAVVPVILFHARMAGFEGGYVGVDVFFVISGYLITSMILGEVREDRFSVIAFYERRIRRIFPALFAVLLFATAMSSILLLPGPLNDLGKTVVSTTVFASNIWFYFTETGYFAGPAELKPLLHTWSLAVEEQFYILFPLYVILVYRFQKSRFVAFTIVVLVASFVLSVWAVPNDPDSAFYLAPGRAWELLVGSMLGMGVLGQVKLSQTARNALSATGLAMIAWSMLTFSSTTGFPGANALFPCLGAAFIIYAGETGRSFVGQLLAAKPTVFIGKISYSLYLWHLPLLVFAKHYAIRDLRAVETIGVVAASFLISAASWRYIETPFRGKRGLFTRRHLFATAGATMVLTFAMGFAINFTDGWPQRLNPRVVQLASGVGDRYPGRRRCTGRSPTDIRQGKYCRIGDETAEPSFVVWGDSHADALLYVIGAAAAEKGKAGLFLSRWGCVPLIDVGLTKARFGQTCRDFGNEIVKLIEERKNIRDVILIARWALYAMGERYGVEKGGVLYIQDSQSAEVSVAENKAAFERGVERTVRSIREMGRNVVIVAQVPPVGWHTPSALARIEMLRRSLDIAPSVSDYMKRQDLVLKLFRKYKEKYGLDILYPHEYLCNDKSCPVRADDRSLYYDNSHLSLFGSNLVMDMFSTLFESP